MMLDWCKVVYVCFLIFWRCKFYKSLAWLLSQLFEVNDLNVLSSEELEKLKLGEVELVEFDAKKVHVFKKTPFFLLLWLWLHLKLPGWICLCNHSWIAWAPLIKASLWLMLMCGNVPVNFWGLAEWWKMFFFPLSSNHGALPGDGLFLVNNHHRWVFASIIVG